MQRCLTLIRISSLHQPVHPSLFFFARFTSSTKTRVFLMVAPTLCDITEVINIPKQVFEISL